MKQINRRFLFLKNQSGINMVDLMMWLVIAALLLAAALQGIGYYQKAAYLNNMKLAAHDAGTNAFAVAAGNDGKITEEIVTTAASDTKWSTGLSYSVESSSQTPYIRVTDSAVPDKEVIYLFESCGDYPIGVNMVSVGGTPELAECGVAPTAPSSGTPEGNDGGAVQGEYSVPETADAIAYNAVTNFASGTNPNVINYLNTEIEAYANKTIMEYDWDAFQATAISQEYSATYPFRTGAKDWTDYYNIVNRTDNPEIVRLAEAFENSWDLYWDAIEAQYEREAADPNAKNDLTEVKASQRVVVDALSDWYRAAAALPVDGTTMVVSASDPNGLSDRTITAGSESLLAVSFDTPESLNVAGNQDRFSFYAATHHKGTSNTVAGGRSYQSIANDAWKFSESGKVVSFRGQWQTTNWPVGVTEMVVGVLDTQTGITYYSTINITVE